MEEQNLLDNNLDGTLAFNEAAKAYLRESAKWAKFLSIIGFIIVAFIVIGALFFIGGMGAMATMAQELPLGFSSAFVGFFYLIIAAFMFFPAMFLNKFSKKVKSGLEQSNSTELAAGMEYLKSWFKFRGIVTLIVVVFYGLIIIGSLVFGAAMMF